MHGAWCEVETGRSDFCLHQWVGLPAGKHGCMSFLKPAWRILAKKQQCDVVHKNMFRLTIVSCPSKILWMASYCLPRNEAKPKCRPKTATCSSGGCVTAITSFIVAISQQSCHLVTFIPSDTVLNMCLFRFKAGTCAFDILPCALIITPVTLPCANN